MWAQVKFEYDQQVILTPLSNFKDHHQVAEELKELQTRPFYDVFWSPDPEDTPDRIMKREKRILHQDMVRAQVKDGKKKAHKPEAGWYRATIKQWDESLEKLEKLLDDPSGRKRKQGAELIQEGKKKKITEKRENRIFKEIARKKSTLPSTQTDEVVIFSRAGEEIEISSSANTQTRDNTKSKNNVNTLSDSEESDDTDRDGVTFWEHHTVSSELKEAKAELKKYKNMAKDVELVASLQKEVNTLKMQNKRLIDLNIYWQEQVRNMSSQTNPKKKCTGNSEHAQKDTPLCKKSLLSMYPDKTSKEDDAGRNETTARTEPYKQPEDQFDQIEHEQSTEQEMTVPVPSEEKPAVNHQPTDVPIVGSLTPTNTAHAVVNRATPTITKQKKADKSSFGGIRMEPSDFKVTAPDNVNSIGYEQFMKIAGCVQAGEAGDSQFYKNCVACLWSDDTVLAQRSVTGAACPNDQTKVQKKECTPAKKEYLKELLEVRIRNERFPVDAANLERRTTNTQLNKYLRQKIKTVMRNLKMKNQL